jgi:hypothetical protein
MKSFAFVVAVLMMSGCAAKAVDPFTSVSFDGAGEPVQGDPIAAASVLVTSSDGAPLCNGVLLGDGVVATAAACAHKSAGDYKINARGPALLPVLELIKAEDIALLKIKFDALPENSRAVALGGGDTKVDGTLRLATYFKNGEKLAIAPGKIDPPESVPGYLALRLDSGGKLSERQLGSGIYADLDGKPVLVGLFTTSSKRGNVVFIQDVRGKELVTGH